MKSFNPITMAKMSGLERLKYSLMDLFNTPKGMSLGVKEFGRYYGSLLHTLIGQSLNPNTASRACHFCAMALLKPDGTLWEPEYELTKVIVDQDKYAEGALFLKIFGRIKINDTYSPLNLEPFEVPLLRAA